MDQKQKPLKIPQQYYRALQSIEIFLDNYKELQQELYKQLLIKLNCDPTINFTVTAAKINEVAKNKENFQNIIYECFENLVKDKIDVSKLTTVQSKNELDQVNRFFVRVFKNRKEFSQELIEELFQKFENLLNSNQGYTQIVSRNQLRKLLFGLVCSQLQKMFIYKYPQCEQSVIICLKYYMKIVDKEEIQSKEILVDSLYENSYDKILFFCNQEIFLEFKEIKVISQSKSYNYLFKLLKMYIKQLYENKNYPLFTEVIAQSILFLQSKDFPDLAEFNFQQHSEAEKIYSDFYKLFLEKRSLKETFIVYSKQLASKPNYLGNYQEILKQLVEKDLYELDNDLLKKLFQEQPKESRSFPRNQNVYNSNKLQEIFNRLNLDDLTQSKLHKDIHQYISKQDSSYQSMIFNYNLQEGKKQILIQVNQNKLVIDIQSGNQIFYIENNHSFRTFKELFNRK